MTAVPERLADLPQSLVDRFDRITREEAGVYRSHPNHLDMLSCARLEVWLAIARIEPARRLTAAPLVRHAARQAVHSFLVSPENCCRRLGRRQQPVPEQIQWEKLVRDASGQDVGVPLALGWMRWTEPDFAPEVIERLWREWLWRETAHTLTEAQRQELFAWFRGEHTATAKGRGRPVQYCRWLNRMRRRMGLPERQVTTWSEKRQEWWERQGREQQRRKRAAARKAAAQRTEGG